VSLRLWIQGNNLSTEIVGSGKGSLKEIYLRVGIRDKFKGESKIAIWPGLFQGHS